MRDNAQGKGAARVRALTCGPGLAELRVENPRVSHPPRFAPSRPSSSLSLVRISAAVLLVTSLAWASRNMLRGEPATSSAPAAAAPLSAADKRQAEILKVAVDYAPDPGLVRAYDEINRRHFGGQLPAMPVVWEPRLAEVGPLASQAFTLEGMFGRVGDRAVILLNPSLARDADAMRRALSHEMVHAWLFTIGDPSTEHGPAFQATLRRLADEGAFPAIVSSPREREHLRAWLESESMRLDMMTGEAQRESEALAIEARGIEEALADLNARRRAGAAVEESAISAWTLRRDAYNRRAGQLRARADRARAEAAAFNAQVERYNLMVSYPDGLDQLDPFATRR
jgi:hypothetical protein